MMTRTWIVAGAVLLAGACSDQKSDNNEATTGGTTATETQTGTGGHTTVTDTNPIYNIPEDEVVPELPATNILNELPAGFTAADAGGYRLGPPLEEVDVTAGTDKCGNVLQAVVRDFQEAHDDFQRRWGSVQLGLVLEDIGEGRKPQWSGIESTFMTTQANFEQWYSSVPDVNMAYLLELYLEPQEDGIFSFQSTSFFPLDEAGFGNERNPSNYHFTTELHTSFNYGGGEVFQFSGDDDLWVFMNGKLVIDLGGIHEAETATVILDEVAPTIGMETGNTYELDLFHAERCTTESNFRIDSSLDLVDCGTIVPDLY